MNSKVVSVAYVFLIIGLSLIIATIVLSETKKEQCVDMIMPSFQESLNALDNFEYPAPRYRYAPEAIARYKIYNILISKPSKDVTLTRTLQSVQAQDAAPTAQDAAPAEVASPAQDTAPAEVTIDYDTINKIDVSKLSDYALHMVMTTDILLTNVHHVSVMNDPQFIQAVHLYNISSFSNDGRALALGALLSGYSATIAADIKPKLEAMDDIELFKALKNGFL